MTFGHTYSSSDSSKKSRSVTNDGDRNRFACDFFFLSGTDAGCVRGVGVGNGASALEVHPIGCWNGWFSSATAQDKKHSDAEVRWPSLFMPRGCCTAPGLAAPGPGGAVAEPTVSCCSGPL